MEKLSGSLGSRRFRTFVLAWVGLLALGALSILRGADSGLVGTVLLPLVGFASTAVGFGAWHDRAVRAAIAGRSPASAAAGDASLPGVVHAGVGDASPAEHARTVLP